MSPLPVDRHGGGGGESTTAGGGGGETTRSIPTPFLTKTYQLVDDPVFDKIISWNEDGSAFVVWNQTEFARDLLPKYFKHNNFSSFVRQLNTYGFRKVVADRWEFSNECFRKGEKRLLCEIHRRKVGVAALQQTPVPAAAAVAVAVAVHDQFLPMISLSGTDSGEDQVMSSTCSPSGLREGPASASGNTAELIGENERLRKDNLQLNKELSQMKSLCSNIYALMSSYASCNTSNTNGKGSESVDTPLPEQEQEQVPVPSAMTLDLMPTGRCSTEAEEMNHAGEGGESSRIIDETNAKLFGVAIGVKRGREETGVVAEHGKEVEIQQRGRMIKVEPLDDNDHQLL